MKKILVLITIMAISLFGCENQKAKSELLENAEKLEWKDISIEIAQNQVAAKDKYEGLTCIFEGYIGEIYSEDYIELNWYEGFWGDQLIDEDIKLYATSPLRMDLDNEDAKTVLSGDEVTVVGILHNVGVNRTELINAYIVE